MLGYIVKIVLMRLLINIGTPTLSQNITQLDFEQMANLCGYNIEEFDVTTEDSYVLKLFHIKGGKRGLPVLLVHGLLDSADTYITRGEDSLSITLANRGYDVWAMNVRGNRYGMRHRYLDPQTEHFWEFTFHEIAYYDLTANIDFVLKKTHATKLNAIGHSQGNLIFYIMGAIRPDYNKKVNTLTALAPISYCQNFLGPVTIISRVASYIQTLAHSLNMYQVFEEDGQLRKFVKDICQVDKVGYDVCAVGIMFPSNGFDEAEIEPEYFSKWISYYPTSSSIKNLVHFSQLYNEKRLAQYDYGVLGNLKAYLTAKPPEYDLRKVTMKVFLLQAENDLLSRENDTSMLRDALPNVADYTVVQRKEANHVDFISGKTMKDYVYPYIFDVLENNLEE